jgi:hypothetical protein
MSAACQRELVIGIYSEKAEQIGEGKAFQAFPQARVRRPTRKKRTGCGIMASGHRECTEKRLWKFISAAFAFFRRVSGTKGGITGDKAGPHFAIA